LNNPERVEPQDGSISQVDPCTVGDQRFSSFYILELLGKQ